MVGEIAELLRKGGAAAVRESDHDGALLGLLAQLDPRRVGEAVRVGASGAPTGVSPMASPQQLPPAHPGHQPGAPGGVPLGGARNVAASRPRRSASVEASEGEGQGRSQFRSQGAQARGASAEAGRGAGAHAIMSSLLGMRRSASLTLEAAFGTCREPARPPSAPVTGHGSPASARARAGVPLLTVRRSASESVEAPALLADGVHIGSHGAAPHCIAGSGGGGTGGEGTLGTAAGEGPVRASGELANGGVLSGDPPNRGPQSARGPKTMAAAVVVQAALNAMAAATPGADPLAVSPELLTPTSAAAAALVMQARSQLSCTLVNMW